MQKPSLQTRKLLNYVDTILMFLLIVLQFFPYWNFEELEKGVSIQSFIWFPYNHKDMLSIMKGLIGEGCTLKSVIVPLAMMVLTVVSIILIMNKEKVSKAVPVLTVMYGIAAIIGYAVVPALKIGNARVLHLVVAIVVLVVGILSVIVSANAIKAEKKAKQNAQ